MLTLEEWKQIANSWQGRYIVLRSRFEQLQFENEILKLELAKCKEQFDEHLKAESKINGWKAFNEKYGENNADTR